MRQIISVIQQKGGVGKTTLAVHLAHELRARQPDLKVTVADADPQQSASNWIARGERNGCSGVGGVVVAADGDGKNLKRELEAIDADIIIVDLPPAIESVSLRAALYANLILIPVGASALDIEAGRAAVDVSEEALGMDSSKQFLLVPSKVRSSTAAGKELRSILSGWGPVARTDIGLRVAFSDAATTGQGIAQYAPDSAAHNEIKTLAEEATQILWRMRHGEQAAIVG
jgi:chromosome partitioning protein